MDSYRTSLSRPLLTQSCSSQTSSLDNAAENDIRTREALGRERREAATQSLPSPFPQGGQADPSGPSSGTKSIYFISFLAFNLAQVRGAVGSASVLRSGKSPGLGKPLVPVSQGGCPILQRQTQSKADLEPAGRGQTLLGSRCLSHSPHKLNPMALPASSC